jgi:hypothetical protein
MNALNTHKQEWLLKYWMVCKNSADSRSFLNGTLLLLVIIKI